MNLKIRLANNEEVQAPVEVWVAAIITELPPATATKIFERLKKGSIFHQTPGSHILRAEGGILNSLARK